MSRTYPFKAWILMPSYKPVQVEFVGPWWNEDWHRAEGGKSVHVSDNWHTKAEAIAVGRQRIAEQEAKLQKSLEKLAKKRAALDKAEAAQ